MRNDKLRSAGDYFLLNIVFMLLSCVSLQSQDLHIPPPTSLTIGPGAKETFGLINVNPGGQLNIIDSTITANLIQSTSAPGISVLSIVDIKGSIVNTGAIAITRSGGNCKYFITNNTRLTTSSIAIDGSIFDPSFPAFARPGTRPFPEMTINGATVKFVNPTTDFLVQCATLNIMGDSSVTCGRLATGVLGQINISGGTITATEAIDSVNPFANGTINMTGGVVNARQLGISGFFDDNTPGEPATSMNISGGQVNVSDTAIVRYGAQLHISDAGILNSTNNGVTMKFVGSHGAANVVTMNGGTLIAARDAFDAMDAVATINVSNNATVTDGGNLLNVISTGINGRISSNVDFTAQNVTLAGDINSDAESIANVHLEKSTTLTAAINQNQLTGATGINPSEQIAHPIAPGLPPFTVNLGIDSTSTWNMRLSSTLDTLTVNPQAHINFADPPADPFKTLVMNNLIGTGGIFRMNVDLGLVKGDLIEILTKSEGEHLLTFANRNQGSDLPANTALLVVRTPDGGAGFRGEADGGTFRYFVFHGDGSSVTPIKNDWYLVRGDEITPPETTFPPPTNPNPTPTPPPTGGPTPPEFTPGDNLPLPPEPPPRRLSRIDDLTPAANAAIGTFAAAMPLFYADMDTLIERLGELRLLAQAAPVPTTTIPSGISKEVVAPPPPVAPLPGGGVWFRGFGSGSHVNDQVSRSFDQNLGGFQIGADKRLVTRYGDLYLGGFLGYFYAHRDFQNQPFDDDATGTTNAFSVGAYSTLMHPSGFYADLVVKYTQLWNDFDAPNFLSFLGLGSPGTANYTIPTFGASLEIGKRWDFGHFFLEPQGQIEGAWAGGADYTVSNGLRVSADNQTSLRGRLGVRAGLHFDWGSRVFEPYAKVSVTNEFLGGDRITTDQTAFSPTLSGVGIQAAGGVTARLTDSIYVYGEYDYANSDKIRMPWAVDVGFRLQW